MMTRSTPTTTTTTTTMRCFYLLILVVVSAAARESPHPPPKKPIKLQLYHQIDLENSSYESYYQSRLRSDPSRLEWIRSQKRRAKEEEQKNKNNNSSSMYEQELGYVMPLGNPFETGEYVFDASIGNPPTEYKFQIDTGSNVPWLQCEPCTNCYPQAGPIYNPLLKEAKDSKVVEYREPLCKSTLARLGQVKRGPSGECKYVLRYADKSNTSGYLITDRLTFGKPSDGDTLSEIIPIGCSVDTRGMFTGQAGLMGFTRGPLSIVNSLLLETFSYCLVTPGNKEAQSTLVLNDVPPTDGSYSISLQTKQPLSNNFLYVNLLSIAVNNIHVDIPEGTFELKPDNPDTGVILDSGSTLTYFTRAAYDPLKEVFVRETHVPVKEPHGDYDLCFDATNRGLLNTYPTLTYYFDQGTPMVLRRLGAYINSFDDSTDCFAILPNDPGDLDSIIGAYQMYGSRFHFDLVKDVITVTEGQC